MINTLVVIAAGSWMEKLMVTILDFIHVSRIVIWGITVDSKSCFVSQKKVSWNVKSLMVVDINTYIARDGSFAQPRGKRHWGKKAKMKSGPQQP